MLKEDIKEFGTVFEKKRQFEELAFPHMDSLYNTALRMTRNELDAEDLMQDVYVRAFRFFHKFKRDTNFKAWIFKILTNTYINLYRKKIKQAHKVELDDIRLNKTRASSEGHEELIAKYNRADENYKRLFDDEIISALELLSDEFRIVVLLADIELFSYKDIAEITGSPLGTVMSRLSRGRKQLQNQLREYAQRQGFINKPNQ